MGGWASGLTLDPAKRAEVERDHELASAFITFRGRHGLEWDDALDFFQSRDPQVQLFQRVLLHPPRAVGSCGVPEEIGFETATQNRPDGFVNCDQFIDSDASLVARVVA
jgi:hypothetical protein